MILGSQYFEIRNQNILTSLLSPCLEFCWGLGRCQGAQCLIHEDKQPSQHYADVH